MKAKHKPESWWALAFVADRLLELVFTDEERIAGIDACEYEEIASGITIHTGTRGTYVRGRVPRNMGVPWPSRATVVDAFISSRRPKSRKARQEYVEAWRWELFAEEQIAGDGGDAFTVYRYDFSLSPAPHEWGCEWEP